MLVTRGSSATHQSILKSEVKGLGQPTQGMNEIGVYVGRGYKAMLNGLRLGLKIW